MLSFYRVLLINNAYFEPPKPRTNKDMEKSIRYGALLTGVSALVASCGTGGQGAGQDKATDSLSLKPISGSKAMNVVFVLTDDHRYDYMSFMGGLPFLETPNMDKMAAQGAHFKNAFVTTSLSSPSRASVLTGLYVHQHGVVNNGIPVPEHNVFFPQYLQKAGYQTAFVGKWHMGHDNDDPRPGFDHWVSFKGQGMYYGCPLNVDGERVQLGEEEYITDVLTDYALKWLEGRDKEKPFFLYISHKAVHAGFTPAKRHMELYSQEEYQLPENERMYRDDSYKENDMPEWIKEQRCSFHGIDSIFLIPDENIDIDTLVKQYARTVVGIDENLGRVIDYLEKEGLAENTVVIYMGDNGFSLGEHALIDKRQMFEESIRVPLLAWGPGMIEAGTKIDQICANIDIAPTVLELCGLTPPEHMAGKSMAPLLKGKQVDWRDKLYYVYYWENAFSQTPATFGVRGERYKYIWHHGIWDYNQFYDLQEDPNEMHNLIRSPDTNIQKLIDQYNTHMWDFLEATDGMQIPLTREGRKNNRKYSGWYY